MKSKSTSGVKHSILTTSNGFNEENVARGTCVGSLSQFLDERIPGEFDIDLLAVFSEESDPQFRHLQTGIDAFPCSVESSTRRTSQRVDIPTRIRPRRADNNLGSLADVDLFFSSPSKSSVREPRVTIGAPDLK